MSGTFPTLDTNLAFVGPAGEYALALEGATEADPGQVLLSVLVRFGNALGRSRWFTVEATRHHANLFALFVGETSKARKGTGEGRAQDMMLRIDPEWASERVQHGLLTGEGLIWAIRDGTGEDDPGIEDKRLLAMEAEFASVLAAMDRKGQRLSSTLRLAWDGADLCSMTRNGGKGGDRSTAPHVSLIAHITKSELLRTLNSTEAGNGFGNRILFAAVKRSCYLPHGGRAELAGIDRAAAAMAAALDCARAEPWEMLFDVDAGDLWTEVYQPLSEGLPGMLGAVTARAEAQTRRLAMVYAALDRAERIGMGHLSAALAVWQWCHDSAFWIFGAEAPVGSPLADSILKSLREAKGEGLTKTEITRKLGGHRKAHEIDGALGELEAFGLAKSKTIPASETGGAAAVEWHSEEANLMNLMNQKASLPRLVHQFHQIRCSHIPNGGGQQ